MAADVKYPPIHIPEPVLDIARKLEGAGFEAWCVGGNLRDAFLDHPHSDYDIATSATPEQVQKLFPRTVEVGIKYGTVGVLDRARHLHEVTTFRRDVATDGRHAVVAYGVTLEEDLARRDFTINALAYHPLRHEWRDPFGGAADLAKQLVRAVGDPGQRFREDYLRILRAVRFAARFEFTIDPATWEAAKAAAPVLTGLSAERVRDEWFKSLRTARSVTQLLMLWVHVGAARVWIPELEAALPSQKAYPDPPLGDRDPVLLTALVCPSPVAVLRRLKASNAEIARAAGLERGPEEPRALDQLSVRLWLADVGPAADDLSALWALRHGGQAPWSAAMAEIRQRKDPLSRGDLAIGGADLQELGIQGPRIGETLATLLDRVLEDPTLNTREALLAVARKRQ
ncbi:MAG: tRNA cytidylyltransferase [Gemmatimonadales bacterium]